MHVNDILDRPDLQYQAERFFRRVDWSKGPLACWPFIGRIGNKGYGAHRIGTSELAAHRTSYVLSFGPLPAQINGFETCVLHHCDNPICCNPTHLFLGSNHDNMLDMVAKNRQARGERSGRAKLTEQDVVSILSSDEPASVLVQSFNVSQQTIHMIRLRRTWRHLPSVAVPVKPRVGEKASGAKLTSVQVQEIRADPRSHRVIAEAYGVSRRHIGHLKEWRSWKHLPSNPSKR